MEMAKLKLAERTADVKLQRQDEEYQAEIDRLRSELESERSVREQLQDELKQQREAMDDLIKRLSDILPGSLVKVDPEAPLEECQDMHAPRNLDPGELGRVRSIEGSLA